jgi:hypothetical protein
VQIEWGFCCLSAVHPAEAYADGMRKLSGVILILIAAGIVLTIIVSFTSPSDWGLPVANEPAVSAASTHHNDPLHQAVIDDVLGQYRMVERSGTATDRCVRAGLVAEAYLQAHDEPNYDHWKATRDAQCARAGMPPN